RTMFEPVAPNRPRTLRDADGVDWRALGRRLTYSRSRGDTEQKSLAPPGAHSALFVVAAVSTEGVATTLRKLSLALSGLAVGTALLALLGASRISRRALRPVTAMASAARAIEAVELNQRLPVAQTRDELEELGRSFNALLDRLQESYERQARFSGD